MWNMSVAVNLGVYFGKDSYNFSTRYESASTCFNLNYALFNIGIL